MPYEAAEERIKMTEMQLRVALDGLIHWMRSLKYTTLMLVKGFRPKSRIKESNCLIEASLCVELSWKTAQASRCAVLYRPTFGVILECSCARALLYKIVSWQQVCDRGGVLKTSLRLLVLEEDSRMTYRSPTCAWLKRQVTLDWKGFLDSPHSQQSIPDSEYIVYLASPLGARVWTWRDTGVSWQNLVGSWSHCNANAKWN